MRPPAPRYVQIFPTLRCGSGCGFCFTRGLPRPGDMGLGDFGRLLEVLWRAGVREADILGGEPTEHPDFPGLIHELFRRGFTTSVSSNGSDPGALARVARRYPAERVRIGVSLNSRDIPAGLDGFIRESRPMLKSVYGRGGAPPALEMYAALEGIEYYLIYMDAVRKEDLSRTVPFFEYHRALQALRGRFGRLSGVHCGFLQGGGCPAGSAKLTVMPDGSAWPCYLLAGREEFRLGNLLSDGFRSVWEHPALDLLRGLSERPCPGVSRGAGRCGLRASCSGGCPAVSLLVAGDLRAPEPRCVSGAALGAARH
ncbi:MAG: SPASM domain-containing protein [Thermodesulfovibrionales bacterium]